MAIYTDNFAIMKFDDYYMHGLPLLKQPQTECDTGVVISAKLNTALTVNVSSPCLLALYDCISSPRSQMILSATLRVSDRIL